MKREKKLTKRERKALEGGTAKQQGAPHIHCVHCGRHINQDEFTKSPIGANFIKCAHGTRYACCTGCIPGARARLDEHDRTGNAVKIAPVWH